LATAAAEAAAAADAAAARAAAAQAAEQAGEHGPDAPSLLPLPPGFSQPALPPPPPAPRYAEQPGAAAADGQAHDLSSARAAFLRHWRAVHAHDRGVYLRRAERARERLEARIKAASAAEAPPDAAAS
jgi:hypothetical protein